MRQSNGKEKRSILLLDTFNGQVELVTKINYLQQIIHVLYVWMAPLMLNFSVDISSILNALEDG